VRVNKLDAYYVQCSAETGAVGGTGSFGLDPVSRDEIWIGARGRLFILTRLLYYLRPSVMYLLIVMVLWL